jgi:hypothetical protein
VPAAWKRTQDGKDEAMSLCGGANHSARSLVACDITRATHRTFREITGLRSRYLLRLIPSFAEMVRVEAVDLISRLKAVNRVIDITLVV